MADERTRPGSSQRRIGVIDIDTQPIHYPQDFLKATNAGPDLGPLRSALKATGEGVLAISILASCAPATDVVPTSTKESGQPHTGAIFETQNYTDFYKTDESVKGLMTQLEADNGVFEESWSLASVQSEKSVNTVQFFGFENAHVVAFWATGADEKPVLQKENIKPITGRYVYDSPSGTLTYELMVSGNAQTVSQTFLKMSIASNSLTSLDSLVMSANSGDMDAQKQLTDMLSTNTGNFTIALSNLATGRTDIGTLSPDQMTVIPPTAAPTQPSLLDRIMGMGVTPALAMSGEPILPAAPTPTLTLEQQIEAAKTEMSASLFDYSAVLSRNATTEQQTLFNSPETILGRLVEQSGTGLNGQPYDALVDLETNTILFLKTQNTKTGEWSWEAATMGKLGDLNGVTFDYSKRGFYPENIQLIQSEKITVTFTTELDTNTVFSNFSETDWQTVLTDWEVIKKSFSENKVPIGFRYDWSRGDSAVKDVFSAFPKASIRSQALMESSMNLESLKNIKTSLNLTNEDMLKFLEFTVKSRVVNYPQISKWDASDEISNGFVNEQPDSRFWTEVTGLNPSNLAILVGGWIKEINPNAKTYITEDAMFDTTNVNAKWSQDYFFNKFILEVAELNKNKAIDGVINENNWWIYEPQNWEKIAAQIDILKQLGFEVGGSETMIVSGETPINDDPANRPKRVTIDNLEKAQADFYYQWVKLYLGKGINTLGFGGPIDDKSAWTEDIGNPDANPLLLDDNLKPKLAYFAIMKALSESILEIKN